MVEILGHLTPEDAHKLLASPDIQVTNARDKEIQLAKISKTEKRIRKFMAAQI